MEFYKLQTLKIVICPRENAQICKIVFFEEKLQIRRKFIEKSFRKPFPSHPKPFQNGSKFAKNRWKKNMRSYEASKWRQNGAKRVMLEAKRDDKED